MVLANVLFLNPHLTNTMKTTFKAVLFGALVASSAFLASSPFTAKQAKAADVPFEQYTVVVANKLPGPALEAELNRLGADGWKVRTAVGMGIIMAR